MTFSRRFLSHSYLGYLGKLEDFSYCITKQLLSAQRRYRLTYRTSRPLRLFLTCKLNEELRVRVCFTGCRGDRHFSLPTIFFTKCHAKSL